MSVISDGWCLRLLTDDDIRCQNNALRQALSLIPWTSVLFIPFRTVLFLSSTLTLIITIMSLPTRRQVWILANPPSGPIQPDTFRLEEAALPEVKDGEVLIQVDYLSNDPAQRGMIQAGADPKRAYRPPLTAGQPMGGTAVGKVLASKSQKYAAGDVVTGRFGWTDYDVIPDSQIDGRAV